MIETLQVTTDNSFNGPKDDCDLFLFPFFLLFLKKTF